MQFGFRSKRSCTHSISTLTDYMRSQIDNKISKQACFSDLIKAFDSINHNILLQNFYAYGLRGPIYDLIDDFWKTKCNTSVGIKKRSTPLKTTTGAPERSLLGPFLFLIPINDLSEYAKSNNQIAMFADDTSLVKSGKRKDFQTQEVIDGFVSHQIDWLWMLQNAKYWISG